MGKKEWEGVGDSGEERGESGGVVGKKGREWERKGGESGG